MNRTRNLIAVLIGVFALIVLGYFFFTAGQVPPVDEIPVAAVTFVD